MSETGTVVTETVDAFGKPLVKITSDKTTANYTVFKRQENGFFFAIQVSRGKLPRPLTGKFTTMKNAVKATTDYIRGMEESKAVRRDKTWEENHKE